MLLPLKDTLLMIVWAVALVRRSVEWRGNRMRIEAGSRLVPLGVARFRLREMTVANRVVVSPMDMYSAKDGVPNDFHLVHYGSRATGGAGGGG